MNGKQSSKRQPRAAGITAPSWGTDCDYWDHKSDAVPEPTLDVEDGNPVVGVLLGPSGDAVQYVRLRGHVPFGFRGRNDG